MLSKSKFGGKLILKEFLREEDASAIDGIILADLGTQWAGVDAVEVPVHGLHAHGALGLLRLQPLCFSDRLANYLLDNRQIFQTKHSLCLGFTVLDRGYNMCSILV